MENPIKMDDLGVPLFSETSILNINLPNHNRGHVGFQEGIAVPVLAFFHLPVFDDHVKLKLRFLHSMSNISISILYL